MATILFPDWDALRLALASGAVPDAVARAPVRAGIDAHGRLWVEPSVALPRSANSALTRQGALVQGTSGADLTESAATWVQLLPLTRASAPDAGEAPVLFDLPDATALPPFVAELRRLGSGRVGFRVGERESRALVLVERPPLAAILRASDRVPSGPQAYVKQAPRVWVEYGYVHPLAERIAPPAGQVALLGVPRTWEWLTDSPFKTGLEQFAIPIQPTVARDVPGDLAIPLDLRLVASRDREPAELWVLEGPAVASLHSLVEQSDDRLIGRLEAAFATVGLRSIVMVRARAGRGVAPVLVLEGAAGYRPISRLPNLFAPIGRKLRPPLRRDAVRTLLAADPRFTVWLEESPEGRFTAHSQAETAFRPLTELVEYRVEGGRETLTCPDPASILPLSNYIVRNLRPAPVRPRTRAATPPIVAPVPPGESSDSEGWLHKIARWFTPRFGKSEEPANAEKPGRAIDPTTPEMTAPPLHAWEERRRELENRFLVTAVPDDAERSALWPELAGLYSALSLPGDAAACWLHALWNVENPEVRWARGWLAAEARTPNPEIELERWLTGTPTPATVRTVAAFVVWSAAQELPLPALGAALAHAQRLLDEHEAWLPIRAAWLSRAALSRLTGGDAIGLARCRDRLLDRLYHHGLSADLDVPTFLRFAGQVTGERRQEVRDWLLRTRESIHRWVAQRPQQPVSARHSDAVLAAHDLRLPEFGLAAAPRGTRGYVDLILAWALARLGERAAHQDLIAQGRAALGGDDPVHAFLADAYNFRIGQALEGRTQGGPLDASLLARLGELAERERTDPTLRGQQIAYKIERLRQASRILEPVERVRAYEEGHLHRHESGRTALRGLTDRDELASRLTDVIVVNPERLPRALAVALDLAPRVGEAFANEILDRLLEVVDRWSFTGRPDSIEAEVAALERGWLVAAHFDRTDAAQRLTACLGRLLDVQTGVDQSDAAGGAEDALLALIGQGLRGLRRLGLREESDRLLDRLTEWVAPVGSARPRPAALRRRLHLTGGWFYVGRDAEANTALDEARLFLFTYDLPARDQTNIACAYVAALGLAPVRLALGRIEEVFQRLQGVYDQLSTNSHFSLARLRVVESAVLALVNDDFALGPTVRRWLDDDEFRVRQRINRELRALVPADER